MSSGGGDSPNIPKADKEFQRTLDTLSQNAPLIQQLLRSDALQNLALQTELAPAFTNAAIAQELQFGSTQRAIESEANRETAAGQVFNAGSLAPGIREVEAIANPGNEAIRSILTGQIGEELLSGGRMDPSLLREVQQGVRSAQTARGISFGAAPISEEALIVGSQAEQLRAARKQAATNLIQLNSQTQMSPFSFAGGQGQNTSQMQVPGQASIMQFFPGLQQRTQQLSTANANAQNMQPGGLFGMGGSAGGAAGGAMSGAAAGSMIMPGIGTAIGGGLGALLGGL